MRYEQSERISGRPEKKLAASAVCILYILVFSPLIVSYLSVVLLHTSCIGLSVLARDKRTYTHARTHGTRARVRARTHIIKPAVKPEREKPVEVVIGRNEGATEVGVFSLPRVRFVLSCLTVLLPLLLLLLFHRVQQKSCALCRGREVELNMGAAKCP